MTQDPQQPQVAPGGAYTIPPEQFVQQQMQPPYAAYPSQAPSPMGYPMNPGNGFSQGGMAYPPSNFAYPAGAAGYPPAPQMVYPAAGANPPPYPGLQEGQPMAYHPPMEKATYQTQPAYNPNYWSVLQFLARTVENTFLKIWLLKITSYFKTVVVLSSFSFFLTHCYV